MFITAHRVGGIDNILILINMHCWRYEFEFSKCSATINFHFRANPSIESSTLLCAIVQPAVWTTSMTMGLAEIHIIQICCGTFHFDIQCVGSATVPVNVWLVEEANLCQIETFHIFGLGENDMQIANASRALTIDQIGLVNKKSAFYLVLIASSDRKEVESTLLRLWPSISPLRDIRFVRRTYT